MGLQTHSFREDKAGVLMVKNNINKKIIDQYIKDYELGNLTISKGGNFQNFLDRLINFYESKSKSKSEKVF